MRYGILGALEVRAADGSDRTPTAPQPRTLLALLLVRRGTPTPIGAIVDELWPERPPDNARVIVQMHVSRLRKLLCPGVPVADPGQLIRTSRSAYTLAVEPGELDEDDFLRLADRHAEALALWRGPALDDVPRGPVLAAHVRWLEERRLAVLEERVGADLAAGRHHELVSELYRLTGRYPVHEAFATALMQALHAGGRRADALTEYDRLRRELAEAAGVPPGPAAEAVFLRILRDGPGAAPVAPAAAQLPPGIADFTGRDRTVADLLAALGPAVKPPAAPRLAVLIGPGGVGKTTVAVQAGHLLRPAYPDGQLAAELRGADGRPALAHEVLGEFLVALGVSGAAVPESLPDRARLLRSRTADRRVLFLLDDACSEQQLRPLLPAGPGCAALITSRTRLLGLAGAAVFELRVLADSEAVELLAVLAGPERVGAEPEAAARLVRLCGGLPLAVRIAGAKLAARPHQYLSDLVVQLADERRRLAELHAGDLDVRATVGVGYDACPPRRQRALRLLSLLDVPEPAGWTMAALADVDPAEAAELLEGLADAQLLQVADRDRLDRVRYRLHDLVRLFARERAEADPADERDAALRRVLHGYRVLAGAAQQGLRAGRFAGSPADPGGWRPAPATLRAVRDDPAGWREAESAGLAAAVRQAHERGWHRLAWELADAYGGLAETCPASPAARRVQLRGLAAARQGGDPRAEAVSLCRLGDLAWEQGRAVHARTLYRQALARFERLDDGAGAARVLTATADLDVEEGGIAAARLALDRALRLLRAAGDRAGEADALRQLGGVLFDAGEPAEAIGCYERCLELAAADGDARRAAYARKQLADVLRWEGRPEQARALLGEALAGSRQLADRHWEAHVLRSLGELDRTVGEPDAARERLTASLALFEELGHRHAAAYTVRALGDLAGQVGRPAEAADLLGRALHEFEAMDDRRGRAYALLSLGALERSPELLRTAAQLLEELGYRRWRELAQHELELALGCSIHSLGIV